MVAKKGPLPRDFWTDTTTWRLSDTRASELRERRLSILSINPRYSKFLHPGLGGAQEITAMGYGQPTQLTWDTDTEAGRTLKVTM
jgi:hypothetical protein